MLSFGMWISTDFSNSYIFVNCCEENSYSKRRHSLSFTFFFTFILFYVGILNQLEIFSVDFLIVFLVQWFIKSMKSFHKNCMPTLNWSHLITEPITSMMRIWKKKYWLQNTIAKIFHKSFINFRCCVYAMTDIWQNTKHENIVMNMSLYIFFSLQSYNWISVFSFSMKILFMKRKFHNNEKKFFFT
jgi:hypothetical protein